MSNSGGHAVVGLGFDQGQAADVQERGVEGGTQQRDARVPTVRRVALPLP
jgi:hypothetical protein